jgi:hypothetical protein
MTPDSDFRDNRDGVSLGNPDNKGSKGGKSPEVILERFRNNREEHEAARGTERELEIPGNLRSKKGNMQMFRKIKQKREL